MSGPPAAPGPLPPHDLRLLAPALAAWLVAAVTLGVPSSGRAVALACAGGLVAAAVTAVAAVAAAARAPAAAAGSSASRGSRCGSRAARAAALVAAVAVAAAAAWLGCALRLAAVHTGPLDRAARARALVELDVTVAGDPRRGQARGGTGPGRSFVVVPAHARVLAAEGRRWLVHAPVLLVTPATDDWAALVPGQGVRLAGRAQPARGHGLLAAVVAVRGPPSPVGRPGLVQRMAATVRGRLATAATAVPQPVGGLLPGLVDGDTSALDPRLADDFRAAGMSHLVAVSGANLAIVAGAVLALARRLSGSVRLSACLAAFALLAFVVVARPSPSVLRAAVMAGLVLLGVLTGRRAGAVPALSAGVLVLVLVDPELAVEPGFALSVAATAGLLVLAPPLAARWRARMPRRLAELAALAVAAQVACAPVLVALWGQLSLVAVPANMLAEPVVPVATVLGVLAAAVAPLSLPVARLLLHAAALPAGWLVSVAGHAATVPGGTLSLPAGPVAAAAVVAGAVLAARLLRHRVVARLLAAGAAGGLSAAAGAMALAPAWPPAGWVFVACDVGQGDALAIRAGPAQALVVDTGPEPAAVDTCLRRLHVRSVPLLVLSHLHADHAEGVPGVLSGRRVGAVAVGPLDEPAAEAVRVRGWAAAAGVPVRPLVAGQRLVAGGVALTVVAPREVLHGTDSDPNNDSLVLRVSAGGLTLLLTGDVQATAQEAVLRSGATVTADVLKVPHHGSADQAPAFLAAVHARVAVVSVGADNGYGHPADATLRALAREGAAVFRTDRDGDVAVVVRGGRPSVVTRHRHVAATGPPTAPDALATSPTAPPTAPATVVTGPVIPSAAVPVQAPAAMPLPARSPAVAAAQRRWPVVPGKPVGPPTTSAAGVPGAPSRGPPGRHARRTRRRPAGRRVAAGRCPAPTAGRVPRSAPATGPRATAHERAG